MESGLDGILRRSRSAWPAAFVTTREITPQLLGPLRCPIDEGIDRLATHGPRRRSFPPSASRKFAPGSTPRRGGRQRRFVGRDLVRSALHAAAGGCSRGRAAGQGCVLSGSIGPSGWFAIRITASDRGLGPSWRSIVQHPRFEDALPGGPTLLRLDHCSSITGRSRPAWFDAPAGRELAAGARRQPSRMCAPRSAQFILAWDFQRCVATKFLYGPRTNFA